MNETFELQGRRWDVQQIQELGQWVSQNPTWSRYRLSRELCTRWRWIRPNGQLADMAARSFLNKLHARALIQLPPCRRASPNRMKHRQLACVAVDSRPVEGELSQLRVLHLHEVSRDSERRAVFESLLAREHYLGYRSPVARTSSICCAPSKIVRWPPGFSAPRPGGVRRGIGGSAGTIASVPPNSIA
jgi:hypothetical protein